MIDYENINEKIAPFSLLVYDEDPQNVASLALVFLEEKMPELSDTIDFDPEGSMFCAYSSKVDALAKFALEFKEFCDDIEAMKDLFSRAELD